MSERGRWTASIPVEHGPEDNPRTRWVQVGTAYTSRATGTGVCGMVMARRRRCRCGNEYTVGCVRESGDNRCPACRGRELPVLTAKGREVVEELLGITREDLSRPILLHCCKDGTITCRARGEPIFNGVALPVFSVADRDEAEQLVLMCCKRQYDEHPNFPDSRGIDSIGSPASSRIWAKSPSTSASGMCCS